MDSRIVLLVVSCDVPFLYTLETVQNQLSEALYEECPVHT